MDDLMANSRQLEEAAYLIKDAEPAIVNGVPEERPAWIGSGLNGSLKVTIGIVPKATYFIFPNGDSMSAGDQT